MKVLFICQANRNRSRTAHEYYEKFNFLKVKSCGIIHDYVTETIENYWNRASYFDIDLVKWADKVIILDSYAITLIHKECYRYNIDNKKLIGKHIDDIYDPNTPELISLIQSKLDQILMNEDVIYRTRKMIKSEDLNGANILFGGRALAWLDEEAAIYAVCQLNHQRIVTRKMSEINFLNPAYLGDIIEIGMQKVSVGKTSITVKAIMRNKTTLKEIVTIDQIVFVCLDENGKPTPHNYEL